MKLMGPVAGPLSDSLVSLAEEETSPQEISLVFKKPIMELEERYPFWNFHFLGIRWLFLV
jgi:hypothetical protein